jgi:UDP-N-acetylglucosamine--N-acetylmuramyl-(pentapeptide) pyrophosphoryl-undecaprenol N-acetylglucosamine transferase
MNTFVLSAGGTAGHLYPAQALAGELMRRGEKIVVMTDARFKNYQTAFPGAAIETVPSAAFSDRSFVRLLAAPFEIAGGIVMSLIKLARIRPAAVVGFGGYPSVPVMLAAIATRIPTAILTPDALLGRANRLVMNQVNLIAANLPLVRYVPKDMSSRSRGARRCTLRCACSKRAVTTARVRRKPRRAHLQRRRARSHRSLAARPACAVGYRATVPR